MTPDDIKYWLNQSPEAKAKSDAPIYAYVYEYDVSPGVVHRSFTNWTYNAQEPSRTVAVYTKPQSALPEVDRHAELYVTKLEARLKAAREELQNIVDADIRNFAALNPEHEFRLWAQNRARHTLALTADIKEPQ